MARFVGGRGYLLPPTAEQSFLLTEIVKSIPGRETCFPGYCFETIDIEILLNDFLIEQLKFGRLLIIVKTVLVCRYCHAKSSALHFFTPVILNLDCFTYLSYRSGKET